MRRMECALDGGTGDIRTPIGELKNWGGELGKSKLLAARGLRALVSNTLAAMPQQLYFHSEIWLE
jgi:hypothetical protein